MFNYFFALLSAIILLPLALVIALLIALDSPGPVLFRQVRVGRNGQKFTIFKFRSMRAAVDGSFFTEGEDCRITRVGKIIRKYRLDEIPQLINVLKGEMAIVGPRPLVATAVEFNAAAFAEVLKVKPGVTGLSAIKYYKKEEQLIATSSNPQHAYQHLIIPQKLRYEIFYIKHKSLWFDLKIIYWTAKDFFRKLL